MVLADMVVADIDFPCGRYGFLLWPISSCCGRYGLWPIWSHPAPHMSHTFLIGGHNIVAVEAKLALLSEKQDKKL